MFCCILYKYKLPLLTKLRNSASSSYTFHLMENSSFNTDSLRYCMCLLPVSCFQLLSSFPWIHHPGWSHSCSHDIIGNESKICLLFNSKFTNSQVLLRQHFLNTSILTCQKLNSLSFSSCISWIHLSSPTPTVKPTPTEKGSEINCK